LGNHLSFAKRLRKHRNGRTASSWPIVFLAASNPESVAARPRLSAFPHSFCGMCRKATEFSEVGKDCCTGSVGSTPPPPSGRRCPSSWLSRFTKSPGTRRFVLAWHGMAKCSKAPLSTLNRLSATCHQRKKAAKGHFPLSNSCIVRLAYYNCPWKSHPVDNRLVPVGRSAFDVCHGCPGHLPIVHVRRSP
jgi:hypothetical protein